MGFSGKRILLIDPVSERRELLARRLRSQGYAVEETEDPATGADLALSSPPSAVVADLWMPSISGIQLCRLLRSEPATSNVPVVLCGESNESHNHFWAERAGAAGYVVKGRTGDVVRMLCHAIERAQAEDPFFVQLSGGGIGIRDRIARHLDAALVESVLSAEVRALASAGSVDRLFDRLAQFMSQVTRYRWLALATRPSASIAGATRRLAIHHHPKVTAAEDEAREALGAAEVPLLRVEDEDAAEDPGGPPATVFPVRFGEAEIAQLALGPAPAHDVDAASIAAVVARELGGALKVAMLMEEAERLATTDGLTGLLNRRAFSGRVEAEIGRAARHGTTLGLILIDIDHFKQINDKRGHAAGDRVIAALGKLLRDEMRSIDVAARWGGEEFVAAFSFEDAAEGRATAERVRKAIETMLVTDGDGEPIPVTASIGLASSQRGESLERLVERADHAMYASKTSGRNRVSVSSEQASVAPPRLQSVA